MKQLLLSVVMLFLAAIVLKAQTITWTGAGDGTNWEDADNWDLYLPSQDNDVIIRGESTVTINEHVYVKSITVQGNAVMTLNKGISFSEPSVFEENVTVNWHFGTLGGSTFTNKGTININRLAPTFDAPQFYVSEFNIEGIVNLINGYIIIFGGTVNNQPTGMINVQSDTAGIGCHMDGCGTFNNYGTIKGNGKLFVNQMQNYNNYGTFEPGASPGTLTFIGFFSSSNTSKLNIELYGKDQDSEYDLLEIEGSAVFNGVVDITMGFEGDINDEFIVATTTGTISSCNLDPSASAEYEGVIYDFSVACRNNKEVVLTIINKTLGIDSFELSEDNVVLYPNPSLNQLTIKNNSNQVIESGSVMDINGRVVQRFDLINADTERTISLNEFASGLYLIKLDSENTSVVKKLIKI